MWVLLKCGQGCRMTHALKQKQNPKSNNPYFKTQSFEDWCLWRDEQLKMSLGITNWIHKGSKWYIRNLNPAFIWCEVFQKFIQLQVEIHWFFTGNTKKHQSPDLKSCPCHISSCCLKCGVVRLILPVEDKSILISWEYLSSS